MKLIKYFIFSFLLLPVVVLSQINNPGFTIIDTYDLFKGTTWADSIKVAAAKIGNYRVAYLASDSSANSALTDSVFTSNPINTTTGNIQVVIKADSVNYDFDVLDNWVKENLKAGVTPVIMLGVGLNGRLYVSPEERDSWSTAATNIVLRL